MTGFGHTLAIFVVGQTGTSRNQSTHNHVFFQALQEVALAGDGCFGEHAGGFLEGRCGNEGFRGQGRLGDTEQDALEFRRLLAFFL